MPKNILIFSDGTGQSGGQKPDQKLSNIYKLYRATRSGPESPINPKKQYAFYDPGLGSEEITGPFWGRPAKFIRKHLSSATGKGFSRNVVDCYEAILKAYQPGDKIFLFDFSRGAYTVRAVSGVMNLCGVPIQDKDGSPLPKYGPRLRTIAEEAVKQVYEHGSGHPVRKYEAEREEKAKRFRIKYATQDSIKKNERGNVYPYFIGVFDTVAALGTSGIRRIGILTVYAIIGLVISASIAFGLHWLFGANFWYLLLAIAALVAAISVRSYLKTHYRVIHDWPNRGEKRSHFARWKFAHYNKFLDPRVRYGRHAQAIDETRADFERVGWGSHRDVNKNWKDWLVQKWFAGNHSDIGGSYPENESRLSDIALQWMVEEVMKADNKIIIDKNRLNLFPDPSAMQHCEVEATRNKNPKWLPKWLHFTWAEKVRTRVSIAGVHPSVIARIALPSVQKLDETLPYRPDALKNDPEYLKLIE